MESSLLGEEFSREGKRKERGKTNEKWTENQSTTEATGNG